ncbi:MAG: hypothetical protein KGS44_10715 [Alphaproteobacteria bacterium]|nr:hypothetical protein [Alphaproteobacteria bacterium]
MTEPSSLTPLDGELDVILAILKQETAMEPRAEAIAAVLAAAPQARFLSVQTFAALAACAVLGLAVGMGAAPLAPDTQDQALDAVIASSFWGAGQEALENELDWETATDG